jgi:hypothetical protein
VNVPKGFEEAAARLAFFRHALRQPRRRW